MEYIAGIILKVHFEDEDNLTEEDVIRIGQSHALSMIGSNPKICLSKTKALVNKDKLLQIAQKAGLTQRQTDSYIHAAETAASLTKGEISDWTWKSAIQVVDEWKKLNVIANYLRKEEEKDEE